ncbi:MAG: lipopolysaccharide biosynthesis protein [Pirellulaceae bacterium]|nr:lipopolysaccharide biosynthesis protein [Pirellulaceae bacterium]
MSVSAPPADACSPRPDQSGRLVDTLLTSMVALLLLTVGQKLIGFVRSIVVCRLLPPEELGTWSMLQALVMTVSPILLLSIPACFGRYFATYQQRGQLANFIKQSSILCSISLGIGLVGLWFYRAPIAQLALGDSQLSYLVVYAGLALIPFAMFSFLSELLLALRYGRAASRANFISTITLTFFSLGLLLCFPPTAVVMLIAFALSFTIPLVLCLGAYRKAINELPENESRLYWGPTWTWMFPIILMFWFSDLLTNLFFTVDKYMIVNLARVPAQNVLAEIGAYEAMHVLTGIFFFVSLWIGKTLLPYMAQEWEEGRQSEVSVQANLSIKLVGFSSLAAGVVMTSVAGPLAHMLFHGKYDSAVFLIPYLVYFYVGCGTTIMLMNYYWCAGIAAWSTLPLILGLTVNCATNYFLIPEYGVEGAAIGTTCGMICQVISLLAIAAWRGLGLDLGVIGFLLASSLLVVDRSGNLCWFALLAVVVGFSGLFSLEEQARLKQAYAAITAKLRRST